MDGVDLRGDRTYYLVAVECLPQVLRKTVQVKEMLRKHPALTINEAVRRVGISRSAFYKYKDSIFPFAEATRGRIVTFFLLLEHRTGVLSKVLNRIAAAQGNILTINQGIPLQGVANVSISFETGAMEEPVESLVKRLEETDGVRRLEMMTQG